VHPLEGLPVARRRQERPPLRVQQREGGRQGDASDGMADEETTHERRLKIFDEPIIAVAPENPFLYFRCHFRMIVVA
jgi:hypothetical protein